MTVLATVISKMSFQTDIPSDQRESRNLQMSFSSPLLKNGKTEQNQY